MFALPFFRREVPALKGARITLRLPEPNDYREWAALRRDSRAFLEPWEPRWSPDELERGAWRHRIRRYREDFEQGLAVAFFIFESRSGKLARRNHPRQCKARCFPIRTDRLLDRRALLPAAATCWKLSGW